MFKKYYIFLIIFTFFNCLSSNKYKVFQTNENLTSLIKETDFLFIQYGFNNDNDILIKLKINIEKLDKLTENNKQLKAKALGFSAQLAYVQKSESILKKIIEEIKALNKNEEKLFIIESDLLTDTNEKIKILNNGLKKADTNNFIKLNLAMNYFNIGNFKKSVELFDESFIGLQDNIKTLYKNTRNLAYHFIKNPLKNKDIIEKISLKFINYADLIDIIKSETNILIKLFNNEQKSTEEYYKMLLDEKYIYKPNTSIYDLITKKDSAYLFFNFIMKIENNPMLAEKYKFKYNPDEYNIEVYAKETSLIKDVPANKYFYNAALILIEKEIMNLDDGNNFFPDSYVTGIQIYDSIQKISSYIK
ncbi:MAG: hypothetical protein JXB50_16750 [Spirochaetes bacterium]|nr:hypothetical protein [Spirochaetota bacterium]